MESELKPCPFCGEFPYLKTGYMGKRFTIVCNGCDVRTFAYRKQDHAIDAWNKRVNDNG